MIANDKNKWRSVKIGDVCTVGRGSSPRPIQNQEYFEAGTIPWIKIADATSSGKYLYETKQYVNEYGASFSRLLPKGSLIVAASGTLGYTQMLGVDGCIHDGWLYLDNFRSDVSKDFLYYLFKERVQFFYNSAYGAAIQNINTTILREMEVKLPPIDVQRKIAAVLSAYDDLIENNTRRIAILEEMARRLYREWFVHFRFPGHEEVKMVEVEGFGRVPEGWEWVSLKEITVKIGSGATPKGGKDSYHDSGITLIRSLNVYDYDFDSDGLAYINEEQAKKLSNVIVEEKDILLNITGASVARCCMVPSSILPARVNQHVSIIRVNQTLSNPFYVLYTLNSDTYKAMLLSLAQGGATREALTKEAISNFKILHPPKILAEQFGDIVKIMFLQYEYLKRKNINLSQTRDLLLPRLISGELDVSELDISGVMESDSSLAETVSEE